MVFSMCKRVDPAQVLYLPFLAFVPCIVLKAVEFFFEFEVVSLFVCLVNYRLHIQRCM